MLKNGVSALLYHHATQLLQQIPCSSSSKKLEINQVLCKGQCSGIQTGRVLVARSLCSRCPLPGWLAVPRPEAVPCPAGSCDSSPVMRSSSTLPVPQPSSAPPTPTRLSGPNSDTEEEERGDLIQFYNNVYIEQIKDFALKYTSNAVSYILCFFFKQNFIY